MMGVGWPDCDVCVAGAGRVSVSGSGGGGVGPVGLLLLHAAASAAPAMTAPTSGKIGRPKIWRRPTVVGTSVSGQAAGALEAERAAAVARVRQEHDVRPLLHRRLVARCRVTAVARAHEKADLLADGGLMIRHRRPPRRIVEPVLRVLRRRTAPAIEAEPEIHPRRR